MLVAQRSALLQGPVRAHFRQLTGERIVTGFERGRPIRSLQPERDGERKEVQQNFPIKSGETAYLYLPHFIRKLKAGGRGAVVIKDTFLSKTDGASVVLRKELLESCNLHTVPDCPGDIFQGRASRRWCCSSRRGRRRGRSGATSSTRGGPLVRPTRGTTPTSRNGPLSATRSPSGPPWRFSCGAVRSSPCVTGPAGRRSRTCPLPPAAATPRPAAV